MTDALIRYRITPRKLARVCEASALLILAEILLSFMDFARLMRTVETTADDPADPTRVTAVAAAVQVAANRLPLPLTCLRRALAGAWMLKRRGIRPTIHYGVAKGGPNGFQAHAWLTASDLPVVGQQAAEGFSLLATFPLARGC